MINLKKKLIKKKYRERALPATKKVTVYLHRSERLPLPVRLTRGYATKYKEKRSDY